MAKRRLTENDYNLLLDNRDDDKSADDCSDLDDSVVDCDWNPQLTSDEESNYYEESDEESLSDILRNLEMEENEEDSDDDDNVTVNNSGWADYVGRHK